MSSLHSDETGPLAQSRLISSATHCCPIGVIPANGSDDPVVDEHWCFDAWVDRVAAVPADFPQEAYPPSDWPPLFRSGAIEVAYAPFDWVNPDAKVAIIGITPGRFQSWTATIEAGIALREGAKPAEAMLRGSLKGAFGGPMRKTLATWLDGIGLQKALNIETCNSLFGEDHHVCDLKSAIDFPVFVKGENYSGYGPDIAKNRYLVSLVRQTLGGALLLDADALVIPLGAAATRAVQILVSAGLVNRDRCLLGFPHPTGAYPQGAQVFRERQPALSQAVAAWAAGIQTATP